MAIRDLCPLDLADAKTTAHLTFGAFPIVSEPAAERDPGPSDALIESLIESAVKNLHHEYLAL